MQKFVDLINECLPHVKEIFPWDLSEQMEEGVEIMILDVREPYEFDAMHIEDSLNVARGVLETAIEWDYEETIPELVRARVDYVVVVCRSGNRSLLAARTMALMGFKNVVNLKTGLRGWSDYE
ncbi:MAG: rhodanese-like domain-containing protein, partial [Gammaproteobacteria bacterium]|nr:rhodanese-like domain-containing protein [Gammaproteobacteria bacterium]